MTKHTGRMTAILTIRGYGTLILDIIYVTKMF
jgi:hypothetical protein